MTRTILTGLAWAATAILIWSGSLVMLRFGVTTSLNAYDLTTIRFGTAALILLPVVRRRGIAPARPILAGSMVILFGAPYALSISLALTTAPSAAAGALNPGVMAIASVLLGRLIFGDRIGGTRATGIAVTALGLAFFLHAGGAVTRGNLILVGTGVMWAAYASVVRRTRVPALTATAIVAVGSAVLYLPVYLLFLPKTVGTAPAGDILLQVVFQGVLVSVVAIYAFNRSAELLGPVAGAALPALIPLATLALGAVALGEKADSSSLCSAGLVAVGLALILVAPRLRSPKRAVRGAHGAPSGDRDPSA